MKEDITYLIVKRLIGDMLGRYRVDAVIGNANSREEINVQVAMFEMWRELISNELMNNGLIQQKYAPISDEELRCMSLSDILELRDFYIK